MARKAGAGADPLRLFCASEDRPYKAAQLAGPVVLLHAGKGHPLAARAELAAELFAETQYGSHAKLFVLDCSQLVAPEQRQELDWEWHHKEVGPLSRQVQRFLQKLGFSKVTLVATGAAVPLACKAARTDGVGSLVVEGRDPRVPALAQGLEVQECDKGGLAACLRPLYGHEARDCAPEDLFYTQVHFEHDPRTKEVKQVPKDVGAEVLREREEAVDEAAVEALDLPAGGRATKGRKALTLTHVVQGEGFSELIVEVQSSAIEVGGKWKWQVGDATGRIDVLGPPALKPLLQMGQVVELSGQAQTLDARQVLVLEGAKASRWRVEGYEPWISAKHANRLSEPEQVGLVLVRGPKVVLVRSLAKAYEGLRLPRTQLQGGEPKEHGAIRAACEQCDLYAEELFLSRLGTHAAFLEGQRVTFYVAFASRPPPADEPDADDEYSEEDEDDDYDWFTLTSAGDKVAAEELRVLSAVAAELAAASAADFLPPQIGGFFGEEVRPGRAFAPQTRQPKKRPELLCVPADPEAAE